MSGKTICVLTGMPVYNMLSVLSFSFYRTTGTSIVCPMSCMQIHHDYGFSLQDERVTRTVARTFAPEFNFYLDFPSPLLWTQPDSDALSLAEILETAEVTFDLWHQIPGSDIGELFSE